MNIVADPSAIIGFLSATAVAVMIGIVRWWLARNEYRLDEIRRDVDLKASRKELSEAVDRLSSDTRRIADSVDRAVDSQQKHAERVDDRITKLQDTAAKTHLEFVRSVAALASGKPPNGTTGK